MTPPPNSIGGGVPGPLRLRARYSSGGRGEKKDAARLRAASSLAESARSELRYISRREHGVNTLAGEYYRAYKPTAFVGIRRVDLDPLLRAGGAPAAVFRVLDLYTIPEPLHVSLRDAGAETLADTPFVLALEATAVQIDAGLNEIPRATCALAVGRDVSALVAGFGDLAATSPVHLVERYLNTYVAARVILTRMPVTSHEGARNRADAEFGDEPVVLFSGGTVGPTRRGTADENSFVLHLAHFTVALTQASSVSNLVAAGTATPAAYFAVAPPAFTTGVFGGITPWGAGLAAVAGGAAAYTDFWGYRNRATVGSERYGVKGFLEALAGHTSFNWQAFAAARALGPAPRAGCPAVNNPGNNGPINPFAPPGNRAVDNVLVQIEPFLTETRLDPDAEVANQARLDAAVRAAQAGRPDGAGVTRADLIAADPGAYAQSGYRYGVPVSFRANHVALGPHGSGLGFAADLVGQTFSQLAPASHWELLTARYAARFQFAFAPQADRGAVIPFQPLLDRAWRRIYAADVFAWEDDVRTPVPVRGVVLTSRYGNGAGGFVDGNGAAAGAAAWHGMAAVYDSCEPGQFVFRDLPGWMLLNQPSVYAATTMRTVPKADARVPGAVGPLAAAAPGLVDAAAMAVAGTALVTGLRAALGFVDGAPTAPSAFARSIAYRYAQAAYQQLRTQPRTAYVTGRFRYDIAPGSVVAVELPADRYVRAALDQVGVGATTMNGIVLRMTLNLDAEAQKASTALQIGFTRTEAEATIGSPLYATGHPFWATACCGLPWSDATWIRDLLGDDDGLD